MPSSLKRLRQKSSLGTVRLATLYEARRREVESMFVDLRVAKVVNFDILLLVDNVASSQLKKTWNT